MPAPEYTREELRDFNRTKYPDSPTRKITPRDERDFNEALIQASWNRADDGTPGGGNGGSMPTVIAEFITLAQAKALTVAQAPAPGVRPGVLYAITGQSGSTTWNLSGETETVYVEGLDRRFSSIGQLNGTTVTVNVGAGTYAAFAGAGGASETYVATENVGGIHAGDSVTSTDPALKQLLVTYQAPGFSVFNLNGGGSRTVPVGTQYAAGFKSFTWATVNSANVKANSLTLRDVSANTTLASNEANDGALSAATTAFTVSLGESRRYRLAGKNSKNGDFAADLVIVGETESYLGLSTAATLTPTQVVALGNAQLQGSRGRTASGVTATGGNYLYYGYDARHGDLTSIILDGAAPVLGAFQKLGDFQVTNGSGAAVTIRLYRSNATNAFTSNTLAFS